MALFCAIVWDLCNFRELFGNVFGMVFGMVCFVGATGVGNPRAGSLLPVNSTPGPVSPDVISGRQLCVIQ